MLSALIDLNYEMLNSFPEGDRFDMGADGTIKGSSLQDEYSDHQELDSCFGWEDQSSHISYRPSNPKFESYSSPRSICKRTVLFIAIFSGRAAPPRVLASVGMDLKNKVSFPTYSTKSRTNA